MSAPHGQGDVDADVDGADFLLWQRALGSPANAPDSGADGASSGTVNGGDLAVWRPRYGHIPAIAAASLVNEEPPAHVPTL